MTVSASKLRWGGEREYIRLFPLEVGQVRFDGVVLTVFALDIIVDVDDFLGSWESVSWAYVGYWRYEGRSTFCSVSIISPRGLSALYLAFCHVNARRY